jgi:hypothetical protein
VRAGLAVAPPSTLNDAGMYRWLVPPMTANFPRLPDWAVQMLLPKPTPARKPAVLTSPQDAEGYRRQALADLHEAQTRRVRPD